MNGLNPYLGGRRLFGPGPSYRPPAIVQQAAANLRPIKNIPIPFLEPRLFSPYPIYSNDEIEAVKCIRANRKVLIILRGPPGCGKSSLAQRLKGNTGVICNTDEYFVGRERGYQFNPERLDDAHVWNQQNAIRAMEGKATPIIIDNTNCCAWEMVPYVRAGQQHGYDIHFLIPKTQWAFNAKICAKLNKHNVSELQIENFLRRFQRDVSIQNFINSKFMQKRKPVLQRKRVAGLLPTVSRASSEGTACSSSNADQSSQKFASQGETSSLNIENAWDSLDNEIWEIGDDRSLDSVQSEPNLSQTQPMSSDAPFLPKKKRDPDQISKIASFYSIDSPVATTSLTFHEKIPKKSTSFSTNIEKSSTRIQDGPLDQSIDLNSNNSQIDNNNLEDFDKNLADFDKNLADFDKTLADFDKNLADSDLDFRENLAGGMAEPARVEFESSELDLITNLEAATSTDPDLSNLAQNRSDQNIAILNDPNTNQSIDSDQYDSGANHLIAMIDRKEDESLDQNPDHDPGNQIRSDSNIDLLTDHTTIKSPHAELFPENIVIVENLIDSSINRNVVDSTISDHNMEKSIQLLNREKIDKLNKKEKGSPDHDPDNQIRSDSNIGLLIDQTTNKSPHAEVLPKNIVENLIDSSIDQNVVDSIISDRNKESSIQSFIRGKIDEWNRNGDELSDQNSDHDPDSQIGSDSNIDLFTDHTTIKLPHAELLLENIIENLIDSSVDQNVVDSMISDLNMGKSIQALNREKIEEPDQNKEKSSDQNPDHDLDNQIRSASNIDLLTDHPTNKSPHADLFSEHVENLIDSSPDQNVVDSIMIDCNMEKSIPPLNREKIDKSNQNEDESTDQNPDHDPDSQIRTNLNIDLSIDHSAIKSQRVELLPKHVGENLIDSSFDQNVVDSMISDQTIKKSIQPSNRKKIDKTNFAPLKNLAKSAGRTSRFGLWSNSTDQATNLVSSNMWKLSDDLICGDFDLVKSGDRSSDVHTINVGAMSVEVEMCDKIVQVTEADILLGKIDDETQFNDCISVLNDDSTPPNRSRIVASKAQHVLRFDKSSLANLHCFNDSQKTSVLDNIFVSSHSPTSNEDSFSDVSENKPIEPEYVLDALNTLRVLFPEVPVEDLEHVLKNCDGDPQWATNVLLDSGHHQIICSSDIRKSGSTGEHKNGPKIAVDKSIEQISIGAESIDKRSLDEDSSELCAERSINSKENEKMIDESPVDQNAGCSTVELSVDMANQLQQLFGRICDEVPAELLNPQQLKVELPMNLAAQLFQCWLKTQTSQNYTDPNQMVVEEVYDFLDESFIHEDRATCSQGQTLTDEQFARQLLNFDMKSNVPVGQPDVTQNLSTKIKFKMICDLFPQLDQLTVEALFAATGYQLDATVNLIYDSLNVPPERRKQLSANPIASENSADYPPLPSSVDKSLTAELESEPEDLTSLSYECLRHRSLHHYDLRNKCFAQAQEAFHKKMHSAASYYAQLGRMHDAKLKEANFQAAQKLLDYRKRHGPADTLDLHNLHVQEAVSALAEKLKEFAGRSGKQLNVVTGSGRHSDRGPKIKPAIIAYLQRRHLRFHEINSGMLQIIMK